MYSKHTHNTIWTTHTQHHLKYTHTTIWTTHTTPSELHTHTTTEVHTHNTIWTTHTQHHLNYTHTAERIVGISTNFAIGFGSFVDKRQAPFVNVNPARLENPCVGNPNFPNGCQAPYSFRHVISLTPNQTLFNVSLLPSDPSLPSFLLSLLYPFSSLPSLSHPFLPPLSSLFLPPLSFLPPALTSHPSALLPLPPSSLLPPSLSHLPSLCLTPSPPLPLFLPPSKPNRKEYKHRSSLETRILPKEVLTDSCSPLFALRYDVILCVMLRDKFSDVTKNSTDMCTLKTLWLYPLNGWEPGSGYISESGVCWYDMWSSICLLYSWLDGDKSHGNCCFSSPMLDSILLETERWVGLVFAHI